MRKSRMKVIVAILLIALVFYLMFVPVTFSWTHADTYEISIIILDAFLILLGVCFLPFTEIILSTHKLE